MHYAHRQRIFTCTALANGVNLGCNRKGQPVFQIAHVWACPKCLQRREVLEQIDKLFADKKT